MRTDLDWQKVILNIRGAGLSVAAVARKVGMDESAAHRLARREKREPSFSQGIELLDIHYSLCPEKHDIDALRAG